MSSAVNWSFNLSILQGPSVSVPDSASVNAYDNISVAIPNDSKPHAIQLASFLVDPDTTPPMNDAPAFIIITSTEYDQTAAGGGALTFTVSNGTTTETAVTLDGPIFLMSPLVTQLLIPSALISSTATTAPPPFAIELEFTNATSSPANVSILVGRTAG
jgi:hypothetical protein